MTLTPETLAALRHPFEAHEHGFKQGYAFLSEFPICRRLDEVDPNWSFEIQAIRHRLTVGAKEELHITVHGRLTVCGVTRDGVGMDIINESNPSFAGEKSAATDALKRAARRFGIGAYLLKVPGNVTNQEQLAGWLGTMLRAKAHQNGG